MQERGHMHIEGNNYSVELNRDYTRALTSHSNFIFDLTTTDYTVPQNSATHFLYNGWSPPERGLELMVKPLAHPVGLRVVSRGLMA